MFTFSSLLLNNSICASVGSTRVTGDVAAHWLGIAGAITDQADPRRVDVEALGARFHPVDGGGDVLWLGREQCCRARVVVDVERRPPGACYEVGRITGPLRLVASAPRSAVDEDH